MGRLLVNKHISKRRLLLLLPKCDKIEKEKKKEVSVLLLLLWCLFLLLMV